MPTPTEHLRIAQEFAHVAVRAGAAIMEVYSTDFAARTKSDQSPVTDADERAEAVILQALDRLLPGTLVISEESFVAESLRGALPAEFLLVDPLDGTREFVGRNGEFTVNIALIAHGVPVAGCVFAPALAELYFSAEKAYTMRAGDGIVRPDDVRQITARRAPTGQAIAFVSRSHRDAATEAFLATVPGVAHETVGSSIKFCRIAAARGDLYPRFGPTMEWDTAAGDAILRAAGGSVCTPADEPLRYGKIDAGLRNGAFIARGA